MVSWIILSTESRSGGMRYGGSGMKVFFPCPQSCPLMEADLIVRKHLRLLLRALQYPRACVLCTCQVRLSSLTCSEYIFSTWDLLFFIAGLGFNSQITLCLLNCFPAVYGVSAMLINVRVGLGFARGAGDSAGMSTRSGFPGRVSTIVFSTQRLSDGDEAWMEQGGTPKETTSIAMTVPS